MHAARCTTIAHTNHGTNAVVVFNRRSDTLVNEVSVYRDRRGEPGAQGTPSAQKNLELLSIAQADQLPFAELVGAPQVGDP